MRPSRLVLLPVAFVALFLLGPAHARADGACCPPPPPPACEVVDACPCDPCKSPWSFSAGLNLSAQSGNTETLNLKVDGEVDYDRKPWLWKLGGYFVYGEQSGVRSAENAAVTLRGERYLARRDYLFAQVLYETDDFAALEYRITPVAGYGRVLVKTARTELKGELGGGVAIEKRDLLAETTDPIAWVALHYAQKLLQAATFKADLDVRPNLSDFDRTVSVLDLKLEIPLCKWMDLALGARLRHEVEPPPGLEELDTLLTVGLKVHF